MGDTARELSEGGAGVDWVVWGSGASRVGRAPRSQRLKPCTWPSACPTSRATRRRAPCRPVQSNHVCQSSRTIDGTKGDRGAHLAEGKVGFVDLERRAALLGEGHVARKLLLGLVDRLLGRHFEVEFVGVLGGEAAGFWGVSWSVRRTEQGRAVGRASQHALRSWGGAERR